MAWIKSLTSEKDKQIKRYADGCHNDFEYDNYYWAVCLNIIIWVYSTAEHVGAIDRMWKS